MAPGPSWASVHGARIQTLSPSIFTQPLPLHGLTSATESDPLTPSLSIYYSLRPSKIPLSRFCILSFHIKVHFYPPNSLLTLQLDPTLFSWLNFFYSGHWEMNVFVSARTQSEPLSFPQLILQSWEGLVKGLPTTLANTTNPYGVHDISS